MPYYCLANRLHPSPRHINSDHMSWPLGILGWFLLHSNEVPCSRMCLCVAKMNELLREPSAPLVILPSALKCELRN